MIQAFGTTLYPKTRILQKRGRSKQERKPNVGHGFQRFQPVDSTHHRLEAYATF